MLVSLCLVTVVYLILALLWLPARHPGYSSVQHSISELGEVGSDRQKLVGFGVFLPVGLVLFLIGYLVLAEHQAIAALAASVGVGYVVAALFPCDVGSPMSDSLRQAIHNLGGGVEYVGGALSLMWISESLGVTYRGAGFVVAAMMIAISFESPLRGLFQRLAEFTLFGGLLAALLALS